MKTNIIFVIDESGSMLVAENDVRGGFNSYVEKLRDDENEYTLTAVKFGNNVRPLFADLTLDEIPLLTAHNYTPGGMTALYDAIGHGLAEAKRHWATKDAPYGTDKTLMIIMTDGYENASTRWSKAAIVSEIKQHEAAGNWTFVYMGADQDAWSAAQDIGFARGNVLAFASCDTEQVFADLATTTSNEARSQRRQTRGFFGQ